MENTRVDPWDALYTAGYAGSDMPEPLLARVVPAGGWILDVGCGRGAHAAALAARWSARAIGIDRAWTALASSSTGSPRGSAPTRVAADAAALPFRSGAFDLVYSLGVVEHLVDTGLAVRESFRVLRSGGWAYHSVPHRYSSWTFCVRPLKKAVGRWRIGRERSFSVGGFERLFAWAGFVDVGWRVAPFSAYDCHLAAWPLPLLYRVEDRIHRLFPRVGFFLHMWGRRP